MRPNIGSSWRRASRTGTVAAIALTAGSSAAATAPPEPLGVPVDDLLATIDGVLTEHPEAAEGGAVELGACPIIDLDGLNIVLADAGTGWRAADEPVGSAGYDDVDADDIAPGSTGVAVDDLTIDLIRCDAQVSDDVHLAMIVAAVPPGYDDFSIDPDIEQSVTAASDDTFGGELLASCEDHADDADAPDDLDGSDAGRPGGECSDVWLGDGLAIALLIDDAGQSVDPDVVREVLLGLVPAVAAGELSARDAAPTAGSVAPGTDGVSIPGGVQPDILMEGTWFDDEGRLYMPESSAQSPDKDAAFCDFLFGTPAEIATVFGVDQLILVDGSGIFNKGGGGTGWRCGYTTDAEAAVATAAATADSGEDDDAEEPGLIFILSSSPFEIDEDPDGIAEYFVIDGGETEQSALLAISDDFPGDTIDADLAETWLTTASARTAR